MKKRTHDEYVAELIAKNLDVEVAEQYVDSSTSIQHHCLKHDIYWKTTPNNVLQGKGCKECQKEKYRKSRTKTHEQYVSELAIKNPMVEVVEKYIDKKTPILHYCLLHDVYWKISPTNALSGKGCNNCMREKVGKALVKSHEQYVIELAIKNPFIEVVDRYINSSTPITHYCLVHDVYWKAIPNNILKGECCIECKKEKLRKSFTKTHEQYVEQVALINPDIEVVGIYINAKTPILHRCKIDNCEWMSTPSNIICKQYGCPQCSESFGERQIRQWLEGHNVIYKYQMPFVNCCDINPLPFDFYLPELNICLEYDGIQHFEPVDFANKGREWANKQLEYTQLHDRIKTEYCQNNNIRLLRISYLENVEEKLNNFLFI